jgi:hypothetical protein
VRLNGPFESPNSVLEGRPFKRTTGGCLGIITTNFRENRLYIIKYLDIYIGVKNASGKCSELFFPQKPPNRPQINF